MLHGWKEDSMLVKRIAAYRVYPSIFNRLRAIAARYVLVGNCNFFYSLAFNAPVGGVPIGIPRKSLVLRKLESWGYQAVKAVWRQVDTKTSLWRTDRRTDVPLQPMLSITCAVILTHVKNTKIKEDYALSANSLNLKAGEYSRRLHYAAVFVKQLESRNKNETIL